MTKTKKIFLAARRAVTLRGIRRELKRAHRKLHTHFGDAIANTIREGRAVHQKSGPIHQWALIMGESFAHREAFVVVYNDLDKRLEIHCRRYFRYDYFIADVDHRHHKGNVKRGHRPGQRALSSLEWNQIRKIWFQIQPVMLSARRPIPADIEENQRAAA
jgi:hypothetical protein